MTELPSSTGGPHVYPMAPLIRSTLVLLYLALVLPLPAFAAGAMRLWLLVMVVLGLVLVLALVSERGAQHGRFAGRPRSLVWRSAQAGMAAELG